MITLILFLIVLSALVFVHELGHFLVARLFGIRVDEFFIGFPPRIWSVVLGRTRYGVNAIPIGGYVKIYGEDPEDPHTPDNILSKPRIQQIAVLVAGVTCNIIFAWLLLSGALMVGSRTSTDLFPQKYTSDPAILVEYVVPKSPADKAGIKAGDEILTVANWDTSDVLATTSLSVAAIQSVVAGSPSVFVTYKEAAQGKDPSNGATNASSTATRIKSVQIEPIAGLVGGRNTVGVAMGQIATVRVPFFGAFWYGGIQTYYLTENILFGLGSFFGSIFIGKADFSQVSGPVGIAGIVGDAAHLGLAYLLTITAAISVNLAIINLLPFPALDGGRVVVVLIEAVIGRRLKEGVINRINMLGFAFLILLMAVVTVKDVFNLMH